MTTLIDYALLAGAAYIDTRTLINRLPVPQGWARVDHNSGSSGFEAATFRNGNEVVVSFAGTYDIDYFGDWVADAGLATGYGSAQLLQAAQYYLSIKNDPQYQGCNITLTGHSLGGGLAALVGVFFGVSATTFDQAPFANSAQDPSLLASGNPLNLLAPDVAANLKANLLASGYTEAELSGLTNFLQMRQTYGGIPNSDLITTTRVDGEFTSSLPIGIYDPIGSPATMLQHAPTTVAGSELHAQSLLVAFLQSQQAVANTPDAQKTLSKVTDKLTELLAMIFDTNLFAHRTDKPDENFLDRLVRHEAGNAPLPNGGTVAADQMVTRFTADLWKLAQEGGLTLSENPTYTNWNNVSRALTAFALQKYYSETDTSTGYKKQLFTDLTTSGEGTNGIHFDIVDVTNPPGISATASIKADLSQFKGYELYFKNYIADTGGFTPLEQQLITSLLPYMRDWYVQAGANGMLATDTLNRGAFMLGGKDSDALVGGTAADLLVGNGGDDVLQGGKGNDTLLGGTGNDAYVYTTGDSFDTILDSDGLGSIAADGNVLAGGDQFGDARVHRDSNGHTYTDVGNGNLVVAVLLQRSKRAANDASHTTQSTWGMAA